MSQCRILGGAGLGLQTNLPKVNLSLFYEREIPDGDQFINGFCQITNGTERAFTINRGTGACTAQFNSIQLKNVRRPDRGKNEELVTEHKYAFVFYSTISVCGEQIPVKVREFLSVVNVSYFLSVNQIKDDIIQQLF